MEAQLKAEFEESIDYAKIPFTRYDFGWVVLCIGMAIGAGIVFLPVQVGITGFWVFALSVALSYPALYFMQDLYLKTISETEECSDYAGIISQYLGKNGGVVLGAAYFLMLLKGMLTYSLAVTFDSAKYLQTFGLTSGLLSNYSWYSLAVLCLLVLIAAQGEKLLFKISGPMVVVKLGIVVLLGVVMIPHWNIENTSSFPDMTVLIRDTLLTIPFTLISILFVQILSPMNTAFRKVENNRKIATYRAIRANRIAFFVLVVAVLFFATSFSLTLTHEQALAAKAQNISALALAASVIPENGILIMTTALNVFAIVTAFLGIFLGFEEAIKGIAVNVISRHIPQEKINKRLVSIGVCIFIVIALWLWVRSNFSILLLTQIASPIYGIVSFLIPCYLVYRVPALHKFKSPKIWYIFIFGLMCCAAPIIKMFGG